MGIDRMGTPRIWINCSNSPKCWMVFLGASNKNTTLTRKITFGSATNKSQDTGLAKLPRL